MNRRAKNPVLLLMLAFSLFSLSACLSGGGYSMGRTASSGPAPQTTGSPQSPGTPAQRVKVGLLLPLSGKNKALGEAMLNAAQMALFDIGYDNFELVPRDTQGTPEGASAAAATALSSGAQLILGPVFAPEVRAAKAVTQRANVNQIAFSTDWSLAGDNTFIMGFLPFDQVDRLANYIASQNIRRVGVLAPANPYGQTVQKAFSLVADRQGLGIVANASFTETGQNLIPVTTNFSKSAQTAQAVLMPVGGEQARTAAKLLTSNGLPPDRVLRLGTGLFDDNTLARDPNLDGALFAAPSPNLRDRFEQRYASTYGAQAPRLATLAYDATALAAVLTKRGLDEGKMNPAFDKAAITNPNGFSGIDGIFRFRPGGTAERGLAILKFENGQIQVLEEAPRTFQALTQ